MKIVTIVGARPQFIKAAAVSRVIRKEHTEILVHTGQHYDINMSEIFFDELKIPRPDYNLNVGSGSHGKMTGSMLMKIELILEEEQPNLVLIYGDTNSTLAGALAAVKMHIPVAHVEAGLRSFNRSMPEEVNRVLADDISTLLFCPTETAVENLKKEGIVRGVHNIGDVMCDAVHFYGKQASQHKDSWYDEMTYLFGRLAKPDHYYLSTIHRAENTVDQHNLYEILNAFEQLPYPVIFPVHPRTIDLVTALHEQNHYQNIHFVRPIGYTLMLHLAKNGEKVITDSGGLQKESYMLGTPCVTVRDQTEWVETLNGGWNILAKPDFVDIVRKVKDVIPEPSSYATYYGDGHAADAILELLSKYKFQ